MRNALILFALFMGHTFGAISAVSVPHNPDTATTPRVRYVWQNDSTLQTKVNEIKDSVNLYSGGTLVSNTSLRATIDADNNGTTEHFYLTRNGSTDTVFKVPENIGVHSRFWGGLTIDSNLAVRKVSAADSVVGAHLKTVSGNLIVGGTGAITGALNSGAFTATTGSFTSTLGVTGIQTNAGDLVFSNSSSLRRNSAAGFLSLSGGSTADLGANFQLFGESHGTEPGNVRFRSGTTNRLTWTESSAILALTGNQTVSGTLDVTGVQTNGNDFVLTGSSAVIRSNTSDAADNKRLFLAGGGATGVARGGSVAVFGNEFASDAGAVILAAGNVATGHLKVRTGADVDRFTISETGAAQFTATLGVTGKLTGSDTVAASLGLRVGSAGATDVAWTRSAANMWGTEDSVSMAGRLHASGKISTSDSVVAASGLRVGSDANLNRSGTNMLNTPDSLTVQGRLEVTGKVSGSDTIAAALGFRAGSAGASDVSLYRSGADMWTTPDSLTVAGRLAVTDSVSIGGNEKFGYDEDAFTGTLTGVTTTITGTLRYVRIGKHVTLLIPQLIGTSNTTACTITGMPTAIRPARAISFVAQVMDNTAITGGAVDGFRIETSGTITILKNGLTTGFTASGTKGLLSGVPNETAAASTSYMPYTYTLQ